MWRLGCGEANAEIRLLSDGGFASQRPPKTRLDWARRNPGQVVIRPIYRRKNPDFKPLITPYGTLIQNGMFK
jgi:hypothetical protein